MPPRSSEITRRRLLLAAGASAAGLASVSPLAGAARRSAARSYPFTLGVASGDPLPDGVVLWTRLAPEPGDAAGGMPARTVPVDWVVARDPGLRRVERRGTVPALPELAHSVHVDVRGLEPGREYFYAFTAAGERSPVGRTRTAPAASARPREVSLALASCQHYEQGYFTAYREIAGEDLDAVFHVGDYIYESPPRDDRPRRHTGGGEPTDLAGYRLRHALYRADPDLQAAHAAHPWVVTWDDHEVENGYAEEVSQEADPVDAFNARRAAAYQAYYEHMPLRPRSRPHGPNLRLFRRLRYGDLATFHVLDTRQYRDNQPGETDGKGGGAFVSADPSQSILGAQQRDWLLHGLTRSDARWNVLAQQVLMAKLDARPGPGELYWSDFWDGYAGERRELLSFLRDRRIANPVSLGGDLHSFWVNDLKVDFDDERAPAVATEFLGTSISAALDPPYPQIISGITPLNPHIKLFESRYRGYLRCTITPQTWTADLRAVDQVATPDGSLSPLSSWVVEDGRPGAVPA